MTTVERITAEVLYPDGTTTFITNFNDAGIEGDNLAGDGIYTGRFKAVSQEGTYRFTVNAQGTTRAGEAFNRIKEISAIVDAGTDQDNDGMPDAWELSFAGEDGGGLDPTINDAQDDPDGDGLVNLDEFNHGSHPFMSDTDWDGLEDGEEVQQYGTNPAMSDSDGGGESDGDEIAQGKDPLDDQDDNAGQEPSPCLNHTVCNGNFEQGVMYWASAENSAIVPGHTGNGVQVSYDGANSDIYQFMKHDPALDNNVFPVGTYEVTAWCLADVGETCQVYVGDANTWYNPPDHEREATQTLAGTGTWQQMALTLRLDEPELLSVYLYAKTPNSTVIYDDVQIREVCGSATVCNGDFEQGLTAWTSTANASLVTGRNGGHAVQVAYDGANSDISQLLHGVFEAGRTYDISAWCYAPVGSQCGLFFGDANNIFNPPAYEQEVKLFAPGTGSWQQLRRTISLTRTERMSVYVYAKTPGSAVLYDDIQVRDITDLTCAERTICNPNFEAGTAAWQSLENAALVPGRQGQGLQVQADGANADVWQLLPGVFPAGDTYRVTAWCLADAGERCGLFLGDANTLVNPPAYESQIRQWAWGTGAWQTLSVTVTPNHDERLNVYLYAPTGEVIYDDLLIERIPDTTCADRTLSNGDFELGLHSWWSIENATVATGRRGQGVRVMNDGTNGDIFQFLEGVFAAGKTYRASAWCLADAGEECGLYLGDANTWYNPPAHEREASTFVPGTGGWQPLSVLLTLDEAERLSVYLYSKTPGSAVIYDDVRVEEVCTGGVCNGDFSQGLAYWESTANATLAAGRSGQGVQVMADGANSDIIQLLPGVFEGGKRYRLNAWCKALHGQRCGIFLGDANTLLNPGQYESEIRVWRWGAGDWQPLSADLTLAQDERLNVYLYAPIGSVLYDDVTIAPLYSLTVTLSGDGAGQVRGVGVECGTDCTEDYQDGTLLSLKALPDKGSRFAGWLVNGEPASGALQVTDDVSVTAVFEQE